MKAKRHSSQNFMTLTKSASYKRVEWKGQQSPSLSSTKKKKQDTIRRGLERGDLEESICSSKVSTPRENIQINAFSRCPVLQSIAGN